MLLYQPLNGYCYNSDSHLLFAFIKENLKKYKNVQGKVLDVGSGSGILGLLFVRDFPNINLSSLEVQENFQFLSFHNAKVNHLKSCVIKNKFQNYDSNHLYDIIISNPPFYPASVIKSENNSLKIARYNDNLPLNDFINSISKNLKPKGKAFFCYDVKFLDDIINLSKQYKLNVEAIQFLHPKKDKKATLVMVFLKKGSKSSMDILPPIIMFNNGVISKEVNDIYNMCDTYSIKVEI
jgi:tRNA1(Val) A37 N6-methylase TrmN6